jgi:hypothetical protein
VNCKKGDIAVVVKSEAGNLGKIVTCGELIVNPPGCIQGAYWSTDVPLDFVDLKGIEQASRRYLSLDRNMKPLRDQDGEDESLSWVLVPSSIKEKT